jgi:glycosyltransferase involved in cell wall biosynthesis
MHTAHPSVSVVLPTRDRLELLRRAVTSVRTQSERDFELIIIDDASTDGTGQFLTGLADRDPRVRAYRNAAPRGGAGSRNEGIEHARAAWIAFMDDDDEWLPEKLLLQLRELRSNPTAVACSCSYVLRDSSGASRTVRVPPHVALRQLLVGNVLGGSSMCMCSADVLRQIGGFDEKLQSAQDLDLWVRLRQQGQVVACAESLVIHWAHRGARITSNMRSQHLGARRFYFKHRKFMDASLRRQRVCFNCFIMSRQITRGWRHRYRYLLLSMLNSSLHLSFRYARSSAPRLLRDAICGGAMGRHE